MLDEGSRPGLGTPLNSAGAGMARGRTASGRFVEAGILRWRRLAVLTASARKGGARALAEGASEFVRLYRAACADLSAARSRHLAPDIEEYLNAVVGEAHSVLYDFPPLPRGAARRWFLRDLPLRVSKAWPFLLASAIVVFAPWLLSWAVVSANSSAALALFDAETLRSFESMYRDPPFAGGSGDAAGSGTAVAGYIQNNVSVSFLSVALGAFFGIGTLIVLVYNGLHIGGILGYISAIGYGPAIQTFIIAHSPFELAGLCLSGASGFLLGWTLLRAGPQGRVAAMKSKVDDILALLCADVMLTVLAAFIEGLVSPSPITVTGRMIIGGIALGLIVLYFVVLPLYLRRRGALS